MASRAPDLADWLDHEREALVQRWASVLRETSVPEAISREDIIDSMRDFLAELATGLRREEPHEQSTLRQASGTGKGHGRQRFHMGYELASVIHEYAQLRDVLFDAMAEAGLAPSFRELQVLSKYLIGGISDAATQYGIERDAQLRRQTAKHLGFLAHELRNPISSARLSLQAMRVHGLPMADRHAIRLERSLLRLSELVDSALLEVRLKESPEPHPVHLDLYTMLQDICESARADGEVKEVGVRLEAAPPLHLEADAKLLYSVLSNLVNNAVKFSRAGGQVRVQAKTSAERVTISVEDACGGLPEGAVEKMFDPFVQMGTDRSGFGLGLAIAKQATEAHGGSLRVHDSPGHGCVFVVELPVHPTVPQGPEL